jgi:hypothetical protein
MCVSAGLAVVHAAEKVLTTSTGNTGGSGSKKQSSKQQQPWVPFLPAARAALPAVLVHTEGVSKTAAMLLHQYEEWQAQQPAAAAAGRKQLKNTKQAAPAPSNTATAGAAADLPPLLSLPVLNSFFTAAADVANAAAAAAAADEEDAAAEAAADAAADAVRVAEVLFARQLLQVKTGLATGSEHQPLLSPDAQTYAALAQLYSAAGQYKTIASIVTAAVRQQLPLAAAPNSSSSRGEMVQTVLAGAAAAWLSAGSAALVPWLLDGVVASGQVSLSHPGLAAALLAAADDELEVRQGQLAKLITGQH